MWNEEEVHPISQTSSVDEVIAEIASSKEGMPITIIGSTDPQRFRYWLDELLQKIPENKKKDILFVFPQSPNFEFEYLAQSGYTVAIFDYYPGIGGVVFDDKTAIARSTTGVKEETYYSIKNLENFKGREEMIVNNLHQLTLGQRLKREEYHHKFSYNPTNAILHMVGNITHIAWALVNKEILEPSILEAKNAEEFFKKFNETTKDFSREELINLVGDSLFQRGFYREMPTVGPNVLIPAASNEIYKGIKKLRLQGQWDDSDFDRNLGVSQHLRSKYSKQWREVNGCDPAQVSLAEFIHRNPPYQNPQIVVPTLSGEENGNKIKTIESRFYSEEVPTLKWMKENLGEEECPIISKLVMFGEKMMGREVSLKRLHDLSIKPNETLFPLKGNSLPLKEKILDQNYRALAFI